MKTKPGFDRNEFMKTVEKRAKEVYEESRKLMKEGLHGLEVLANKTMEVGRLKMENKKTLNQIRGLFSDLGQRVFDIVNHQTQQVVKVTPELHGFIERIKSLQKNIERNLHKLRHLTVSGSTPPAAQSPSAKKATRPAKKKPKTSKKK